MMKHFDIGLTSFFDMRHIEKDFYTCKGLIDKGYSVIVFTDSPDNYEYFRGKNISALNVAEEANNVELKEDIGSLIQNIEAKYNLSYAIYKFVETNYLQNKRLYKSRHNAILCTVRLFLAYEKIFKTIQVDNLFQLYTADIDRMVLWYIAKLHCKKVFSYTASGFPEKEMILVKNEDFEVVGLKEKLAMTGDDEDLVSTLRHKIIDLKKANKYLTPPVFNLFKKFKKLPYIGHVLKRSDKKQLARDLLGDILLKPLRKRIARTFYEMPDDREKYIFYPIHAPIEDQVIVRGFPHRNEFELIKSIALSMPYGYKLYVKEHPGYEGFYPSRVFRELKELSNIKVLQPRLNSHDIIRKAELCIVINSTVWFESLLLGKPVITIGKGFFSGFGVCREVDDINTLDRAIVETLQTSIDTQAVQRFLSALYSVSYDHVFRYYQSQTPEVAGLELANLIQMLMTKNC